MAETTGIAWCNATMNFWVGCTAVSPACDHCYAEALSKARLGVAWGPHAERRRTALANWRKPLGWNRKAKAEGRRLRVFTLSLGDFWDNQVTPEWRVDALDVIRITDCLDWLLLTKRPQNIAKMLREASDIAARSGNYALAQWLIEWRASNPPPNVWLGTTAENQTELDRRAPLLLDVPAVVRFLSCEPLLGPLDLDWFLRAGSHRYVGPIGRGALQWIIVGGESGPGFRQIDPAWARSIRDQCRVAGVAFFFKQMSGGSQRSMQPIPDDLMVREWPVPMMESA